MIHKRRITFGALALAILFAACGDGDSSSDSTDATSGDSTGDDQPDGEAGSLSGSISLSGSCSPAGRSGAGES